MEFYLHNGKIVTEDEFNPLKYWINESLCLKNSMWFAHGEIPFFDNHINHFNEQMDILDCNYTIESAEKNELHRQSKRLINKNKGYMGGWVNLNLVLGSEKFDVTGSVKKWGERIFPFEQAGKLAVISSERKWSESALSKYRFYSEWFWQSEKIRNVGSRYGDVIFCNEKGFVTETLGANLFCIKGDVLITPSLETGCISDFFRDLVLSSADGMGLKILESASILSGELKMMDEIFTVSEAEGFQWIMGLGVKRFFKKYSEEIYASTEKKLWESRETGSAAKSRI